MDISEFDQHINKVKTKNPNWFTNHVGFDSKANDLVIKFAENELNYKLPLNYKYFLKNYGGGSFAFIEINSLDPKSELNLVIQNKKWPIDNFLSISGDGCGGLYGYLFVDGNTSEKIYYWDHETSEIINTEYEDIFDLIVKVGFEI